MSKYTLLIIPALKQHFLLGPPLVGTQEAGRLPEAGVMVGWNMWGLGGSI